MHPLTILLSCLLSLFGWDAHPGTTRITRVVEQDREVLFSKATLVDGVATFECFTSASGDCHYRGYEERCAEAAGGGSECRQRTLDGFVLAVGRRHRVEGLPAGFRHCVAARERAACD